MSHAKNITLSIVPVEHPYWFCRQLMKLRIMQNKLISLNCKNSFETSK